MADDAAVLLIEDNPGDIRLVREALSDRRLARWRLTCCETLAEGLALLAAEIFAAVLLDLTLPDCVGEDTIARVHGAAPRMPIVVLTGMESESISREAVRAGAEDYLVKGVFDGGLLSRAIFYAIEHARMRRDLEKARDEAL
jgi:two-component system cell cycle sensor histidine kinase/response regulator CckA